MFTPSNHSLKKSYLAVLSAVALLGASPSAMAANCTWNPATGNWSSASDWSCGIVPTGGPDTANVTGGKVVTVNTAQSILNLNNAGGVNIDAFGLTLAGGGSTTNTGTINVGSGVTANLGVSAGHNINNTGGVINIANGSVVNQFGSTITGGAINTTGTGALVAFNSGANILSGVTLNGLLDVATTANARERIGNGMTLNGNVNIANGGIVSLDSTLGAANSIGGTGTFNLNDAGARLALEGTGTTTLGANIVVRGQGNIGTPLLAGGTNALVNNGRISADVAGGTLNIVRGGFSGDLTNNNLLDARGGGILLLSTSINNASGQIAAQTGSVVVQNGFTISGGTIATSGTGTFQAINSSTNFLDGVSFSGTLDLTTNANARERIINGATLNGAVNIANGGILSLDSVNTTGGAQTIAGTAVINLNDAGARLAIEGNGTTTLASGITVRGQGNIGQALNTSGTNVLTSNGLISADVAGGTLSITAPAGSGSFINNGTLQAINGGTLLLSTNILANSGSQIISGAGSTVVQNGVKINGIFTSSGGGSFTAINSASNFLDAVTFTGTLDLGAFANARERIINGATINGAINVSNGGILSLDSSAGAANQALAGTVVINLNDPGARLSIEGNGSTTLGAGVTVRGQGNIGIPIVVSGTNVLTNNGLISADVGAGTLNITPPAGSGSFINNGTLQAVNGGILQLSTNITANPSGQIIAGVGSQVVQNGVAINGVVNASGSGVFTAVSSGANVLNGIDFTGTLDLGSIVNSRERIINGATLNGAINLANGGFLSLDSNATSGGAQTIGGTAVINLNDANTRLSIEGNGSTTLGSGITVRGQGNIGVASIGAGTNVLTNNGLISADINGATLNIVPPANSGSFINNGTLRAINGATLLLSTNITANAGSQIIAGAGSSVVQNGVAINGVVNASGTGVFTAISSGANVLNGIDFTGTLDLTSIVNSRERIINGATLNGAINLGNGGFLSLDSNATSGGAQTIGGTAVINLNDSTARLSIEGNGSTTLGAGITVRGQGNVGVPSIIGGTNLLINNGLISADVAGGTLTLAPPAGSGSLVNNSTLRAIGGGTLLLSTNINNAAGLITAQNGSAVMQNGVTITGGTIASSGSGVFQAVSSGVNVLSGVTLAGTVDMTTIVNSRERIINGATINGAVNVANGGILSLDSNATTTPTAGNQTISGTGVINLNDAGARLAIEGNGSTTLAAGLTVRGQGNIGTPGIIGGNNTLFNNGTILADGGTLTIVNPAGSGSLAGTGTLQTSGGTLNLATTGASTQGKLVMGGAGSALNLNTQNLTITNDYTNAQWGTGNSFNARAGVTGTGQILAGGGAAQVIAGSNITNGATNSATLTINNVHVGANTFNYQITDSSVTGPTLRGAIQTTANGGNLTDPRLGGTGVTASNYSSSAGPLAVTYNATSAGSQSALSGQVLNLTSNFSNIADQKLNIVLGGSAAAYNLAVGSTGAVAVANQRVGGITTGALTVSNTAPSGSFTEALNASFAGNTGNVNSTNGSITGGTGFGVAGGASNATAMTVGIDTATAGAKSGTATLNYVSNGTGSSGLGNTAVGSQTVSVTGNVYQIAQPNPSALPATVSLGNFRAGSGAQSQTINIANANIAPAGFQEGLAAIVQGTTGTATGTGFANAAAGASGALQVGLSGIAAGINSGSVQVQLQSNGITTGGSNGLGNLNLGGVQTVNVTGTGWRLAAANTQPATINFGNVLVGSVQSQFLNIQNAALADGFSEKLDASFKLGGTTGDATNNGGSISLLAAGAPANNSAMSVGINTSTIGGKTGQAIVAFNSNGSGTSNLGITGLADQAIGVLANVTGVVGTLAQPSAVSPNPVNFGNVRINSAPVGPVNLSITNNALIGEGLNASIATGSAGFGASGAFTSLAPGATNNSALQVQFTGTSTAGHQTGTANVTLVSDGTFNGGVTTNLPSQTVTMNADVYRLANPTLNTPTINIAARVGDPVSANQAVSITNTSPDIFTEGLKVGVAGASGNAQSNGGSIANLAAQGTDNSSIKVGLASTASAGNTTGQVNLNLTSTGAGTTGATDFSLGTTVVNVVGKVYQQAVALVNTAAVNFGIVHVGDSVVAQNVSVSNTALSVALNDVLTGSIGGATGPFTASGNLGSGLGAGGVPDASSLTVGLNTSNAGSFLNGHATIGFQSHNANMSDLGLANQLVNLSATVNNFANADLIKTSGAGSFSGNGNAFTLDFGTLTQGGATVDGILEALNNVVGPSDLLDGFFNLAGATDFTFTGFGPFTNLGAGQADTGLDVGFDPTALGLVSDIITLHATGHNASGYSDSHDLTLTLKAFVVQGGTVPEPGSLALVGIALAGLAYARRRPQAHQQRH